MYCLRKLPIALAAGLALTGTIQAAEFFDDFNYTNGAPGSPTDPQFECFGWYVRTGGGGPGAAGATWRADYVTWADDPLIAGNRIMRLRASTDGTAAGTFQAEVGTNADMFLGGTYGARVKFIDPEPGTVQPDVQAMCLYKGLLCDPQYSECDIEYTPLNPWSTRCGSQPALHFQTWEQYCDDPYAVDMLPAEPAPVCGSLAGWHTLTVIVDSGMVRYYVDGLLRASHGGEYYPESTMRLLLLHWFADQLSPGISADMALEVDWVYYAQDAVLTSAQVQSEVDQLRSAGVVRRNTVESYPDCNVNGIPDYCEPDSDGDGVIDACETVWYVRADANGAHTGLSWIDAFPTLQAALAVAQPGHEIWVAAGTYRPAGAGGDRDAAFHLISGTAIYGGFAGTETELAQRDRVANRTVLSGDLNGDDGAGLAYRADNSRIVVDASGTNTSTLLDGFTITGANGTYGGGIFCDGGDLAVRFCTFVDNSAAFGAAVCLYECTPTLSRCYFGRNVASADGGAVYVDMGSDPRITACVFEQNQAAYAGGAVRVLMSAPVFTSCMFRANQAQYGGAVQHYESSAAMLANSLFTGNRASGAGGAIHNTNSSPVIINCTVALNSCDGMGGGLFGWSPSLAVVANSIFWGNTDATGNGEQAQISAASATLSYSCVQNWTGVHAGLMVSAADPLLVDPDGPDNVPGTDDDNCRLRTGSPYIDAGDNTALPPDLNDLDADGDTAEPIALDVLGYRRLEDAPLVADTGFGTSPMVDLGPYEYAPVAAADFDYDRDVDAWDLQHLQGCMLGPAILQTDVNCQDADLDRDGDVDQSDFGLLQACYGSAQ